MKKDEKIKTIRLYMLGGGMALGGIILFLGIWIAVLSYEMQRFDELANEKLGYIYSVDHEEWFENLPSNSERNLLVDRVGILEAIQRKDAKSIAWAKANIIEGEDKINLLLDVLKFKYVPSTIKNVETIEWSKLIRIK